MRTAAEILREHGIVLPTYDRGRHYATCPQCSTSRSTTEHRANRVLGITIDAKGVQWGCNHCAWTGGGYYNARPNGKANGQAGRVIIATYDYPDEIGELLYQVCRYSKKDFKQRRPDGKGGWIWNLKDVRKVLYRLPELIEAMAHGRTILIPEGEKDVNNLWKIGLPATCNPGGASQPGKKTKWRIEYSETLRGADVVLFPDNDEPGWNHVEQVGMSLRGIAARVRVLVMPNSHKDVSDWLAAGGTREQLDALIEQAPDWIPPGPSEEAKQAAAASEQELIDQLARLDDRLEYDRRRRDAARELGVRAGSLDDAVEVRRAELAAEAAPAPLFGHWIVEPWDEPIATDALALAIMQRLQRHVIFDNEAALAVSLWILMAWVHDVAAVHSPILLVTSAEANSGKTTLLNLISFLAPRALMCVEISEATLFRGIQLWQPTIIVDEADVILLNNEPLRAVVNSGWTRGASVPRCIGDDNVPHAFPTFCPKALGMKGRKLPDTTLSRSIIVQMKRKKPGEQAEHFRCIDDAGLTELRRKAMRWAADNGEVLQNTEPAMPRGFDNRLGDNWRLLLAIADLAGGDWPERAREAAARLSDVADTASTGARLLRDIKVAFDGEDGETGRILRDRISSAELIATLTSDPGSPWAEWKGGKPMTQAQLARVLKPFGITSEVIRLPSGKPARL